MNEVVKSFLPTTFLCLIVEGGEGGRIKCTKGGELSRFIKMGGSFKVILL